VVTHKVHKWTSPIYFKINNNKSKKKERLGHLWDKQINSRSLSVTLNTQNMSIIFYTKNAWNYVSTCEKFQHEEFQKKQKWGGAGNTLSNFKVPRLKDLGHCSCVAPQKSQTCTLSAQLTQFLPKMTNAHLNKISNSGLTSSLMLATEVLGCSSLTTYRCWTRA
jgi:hypothetical protein